MFCYLLSEMNQHVAKLETLLDEKTSSFSEMLITTNNYTSILSFVLFFEDVLNETVPYLFTCQTVTARLYSHGSEASSDMLLDFLIQGMQMSYFSNSIKLA